MDELTDKEVLDLELTANEIRKLILEMLYEAGSGHSAGPLGMADIFTAFYFHILNQKPDEPLWPNRDRLVLSNGHICPVQYATLAKRGYFPIEELKTLRKINSRLQGHPHRGTLPGIETTSGPLGEGISQAIGIALAAKMDKQSLQSSASPAGLKKDFHVYCITSDGEHQEGNIWEAVMSAAKYKLDNLTVIIDRNNIQIDGFTENVMPLEYLVAKYQSFNWQVMEVDGHNIRTFVDTVNLAKAVHQKPTCIIAHTIPGMGVDFMENKSEWHGKPPNKEEELLALKELRTLQGKIISEHE